MHDIWNPWHGCRKISEGCRHCYMYFLDRTRDHSGSEIYRTANFDYPLQKNRNGSYKIRSGELIRVCMTSDFFLEEADPWRDEAWRIMAERPDVKFYLLTKRPERVADHLPSGWGDGWDNIFFNVTAENQRRAEERIPILLDLPFKHKGLSCAPLIGEIDLKPWLKSGQIELVIAGGENYGGMRPCDFDWIRRMHDDCRAAGVNFSFIETGTVFIKDGKRYCLKRKKLQSQMAWRSGMSFEVKPLRYQLTDSLGMPIPEEDLYVPHYGKHCIECGSRLICNGCADCGQCSGKDDPKPTADQP